MVEKAKERVFFSLENKRFPIQEQISDDIRDKEDTARCLLPRAIIFSFSMSDRHLGEEEVGLSGVAAPDNDESNVSPKQRLGVIEACINAIVSGAVTRSAAVEDRVRAMMAQGARE